MASPKAKPKILRVLRGRLPSTGVFHTLTILENNEVIIEREPYVSDNADKWTRIYPVVTEQIQNQRWLIWLIEQNPVG